MAQRRMFTKTITNSARFLKMPPSTQTLYFHLCMNADDDGVVEAFSIMRMSGVCEDDLKILVAKKFVTVLNEDLVTYIHDWLEHNLIRSDRKIDSKYKNLLLQIIPDIKLIESTERIDRTTSAAITRQRELLSGELPYSFNYKIKKEFHVKKCPICNIEMVGDRHKPTIQHNVPISKGGKHILGNISIICHQCNVSLRDTITEKLNSEEVSEVWNRMIGQSNASPSPAQDRLDKVSLVKITDTDTCSPQESDEHKPASEIIKIEQETEKNPIPYQEVVNLYNEILSPLGTTYVMKLTEDRKRKIKSRFKNELPNIEKWKEYFIQVSKTDFLIGRKASPGHRAFFADFDWLISPSNCIKVLEFKYSNGRG